MHSRELPAFQLESVLLLCLHEHDRSFLTSFQPGLAQQMVDHFTTASRRQLIISSQVETKF